MKIDLENLKRRGAIGLYAYHFGRAFPTERLRVLAALTAHHTLENKSDCLNLERRKALSDVLGELPEGVEDAPLAPPDASDLAAAGDLCSVSEEGNDAAPLQLDGPRIFLGRYRDYETRLAAALNRRVQTPCREDAGESARVTERTLDPSQRAAVRRALAYPFTILTGGPGMGKTTILCTILCTLLLRNRNLRILACAPTGKAQARMREAVEEEFANALPEVRDALGDALKKAVTYQTVHKAVGLNPETGKPSRTAENRLEYDLVAVDEVSMADLPLFTHLVEAVPDEARLILLGDRDQLSSVQSGSILADLCDVWRGTPAVATLTESHRSRDAPFIDLVRRAVISESSPATRVSALLRDPANGDVALDTGVTEARLAKRLRGFLEQPENAVFANYASCGTVQEALRAFDTLRILCANRKGPFGVEEVNRAVQSILRIPPYGRGYPVLVTRNAPMERLLNGDVGICWEGEGGMRAYFPDSGSEGGVRGIPVPRLPPHEPVFAMTIHKSQGSGFERVLMILPREAESRILTRELVYTGLTRAKKHCTVWTSEAALAAGVSRPTLRDSGLPARLTPAPYA